MKKKSYKLLFVALITTFFVGCGLFNNESDTLVQTENEVPVDELLAESLQSATNLMDQAEKDISNFKKKKSQENYDALFQALKSLTISFDCPDGYQLSKEQTEKLSTQKEEMDAIRKKIVSLMTPYASDFFVTLLDKDDYILKEKTTFPIYACKNSKIFINLSLHNTSCKIYNRDNHALLKQYTNKQNIEDSLIVPNSAIYIVEFTPREHQYIDARITNKMASANDLNFAYPIKVSRVESHPGAFKVEKCTGIQIEPIFYEPRKITLAKSGWLSDEKDRTIIAMQVPAKCNNVLYSLSIKTNEQDNVEKGAFCDKVDRTYRRVKFLGLPVIEYESEKSNLFRELLSFSRPVREEDAYCDMYVFFNSKEAKKFQEGADVSSLNYNMDLSKKGTQSCNDRIPTKGGQTIYFGFENSKKKCNVYLWLESLGAITKTEYYKTTYELDK